MNLNYYTKLVQDIRVIIYRDIGKGPSSYCSELKVSSRIPLTVDDEGAHRVAAQSDIQMHSLSATIQMEFISLYIRKRKVQLAHDSAQAKRTLYL